MAEVRFQFSPLCVGFFDLLLLYCHKTAEIIPTDLSYVIMEKRFSSPAPNYAVS